MKNRLVIIGIVTLLFCVSFCGCLQTPLNNNLGTFYVGYGSNTDYQNIQDAIDAAKNGDTIFVQEGKYYETLFINKSIHLFSLEKNKSYIIGGTAESSSRIAIIQIDADNCSVDGFIITRNGTIISVGVAISSSNTTIINNTITDITEGIFLTNGAQRNTIMWNNISNTSQYGMRIENSYNNSIADNQIISNSLYGAYIYANSNKNIFHDNTFYKNMYALRIKSASYNTVVHNCFLNNSWGVYLCCGASFNTIYNNLFKSNDKSNFYEDKGLTNYFTDLIDGGNFYDDYKGGDANNDSFGDTPYYVNGSGNQDNKPLIKMTGCYLENKNAKNP